MIIAMTIWRCGKATALSSKAARRNALGNTAQSVFGAFWKICALILSLFLEIHNTTHYVRMYKFALAKSKIWTLT